MDTIDRINRIYYLLRESLGEKTKLLGIYEFLVNGKVVETDWAISVPHVKPANGLNFRMRSEDGIEAVLEGDVNLQMQPHYNLSVGVEKFKLILTQHNPANYNNLVESIRVIYSIPSIKPISSPLYRPRIPVGDTDASYLPAVAVMELISNVN